MDEHKDQLKDVKEIADAAIEKATGNVAWANKYKDDIAKFIQNKRNGSSTVMSSAVLCVALATLASYFTRL